MRTPHPPQPSYPPAPGPDPADSDASLAAALREPAAEAEATHAVAALLVRHWEPVRDYAAICTASSENAAAVLATAAFDKVWQTLRRSEPTAALRPQLLVTVRDMAKAWSTDRRVSALLPESRKPVNGREMRTSNVTAPENRILASRSFQAIPADAQCLLWHIEVEAEPISSPAALLGIDTETALAELEQAREKFRSGCLRAHVELATNPECRYYSRLLDVPIRRGGALLPDVQRHVEECRHCRYAAEQLSHFDGRLGVLLAESVLAWGGRRYLDTRPARRRPGSAPAQSASAPQPPRRHSPPGRHRHLPRVTPAGVRAVLARDNSKAVLTGIGVGSAVLLAGLLAASLWPDSSNDAGPAAPGGATASRTAAPGSQAPTASSTFPPSGTPTSPLRTRLRNAAADLCLDLQDRTPKAGTGTKLAACSSAAAQQWSYESDGLLRSVAEPDLCLDSHADDGVIALGQCAGPKTPDGADVRYDLTLQGRLIPRWRSELAVAPASPTAGSEIVVKIRNESAEQVWLIDSATASPTSRTDARAASPPARSATTRPPAGDGLALPLSRPLPSVRPLQPAAGNRGVPPAPPFTADADTPAAYGTRRAESGAGHGAYGT
ncbi:ricin-type beta-trefoil lectin domain protein [Streptomyces sp. PSKA54]|uniref:Ricin-type beta-trefoil lectin domain protein n=1 Tax=Streptomyces himalayensis subsp. aureolus TaxID=2758039 RepID=A0A7W2HGW3_9ACTN|nr:ricin-type beta-trefoil lectin domain protein [Streptomyces himalayensis subsp. aureolus]